MIHLKKYFENKAVKGPEGIAEDGRIAACAILLEMAFIDGEFSEPERVKITSLLQKEFHVPEDEVAELLKKSQEELNNSVDLWSFTNQINQRFSHAEKLRVVEMIWKMVYADGVLEQHEDYLVHKLSTLLRVPHKDMINIKIEAREGKK